MPRKRDSRCRGCADFLQFGQEKYCEACSDDTTRKALQKVYNQMNEKDERVVKTRSLRRCKTPKCTFIVLKHGLCKFHQEEKNG